MTNQTQDENSTGQGGFERRDIRIAGVIYFLVGLAVAGVIVHFVVSGLYAYLQGRSEAEQTPVSPLATNTVKDTRHLHRNTRGTTKRICGRTFPARNWKSMSARN